MTNSRPFQPIEPGRALRLLREGARSQASAIAWTKDQQYTFHSNLSVLSENDQILYVAIPKDFDHLAFDISLESSNEMNCRFSVSLSRANIFFKAEYIGRDSGGLKFRVPPLVYQVQTRKHVRLSIPKSHILRATFTSPLDRKEYVTQKLIDISAGGAGVFIPAAEGAQYYAKQVLQNFKFVLDNKTIICKAEVRHINRVDEEDIGAGYKMGVCFQEIPDDQARTIATYVIEKTKAHFMKVD